MSSSFFIFAHSLLAASLVGITAILASKIPLLVNSSGTSFSGKLSFLNRSKQIGREKILFFSRKAKEKKRQLKQDYWDKFSK